MDERGEILIHQAQDGLGKIDETVWLTQAQFCELYQTSKSNISEHIKHIFDEGKREEKADHRMRSAQRKSRPASP